MLFPFLSPVPIFFLFQELTQSNPNARSITHVPPEWQIISRKKKNPFLLGTTNERVAVGLSPFGGEGVAGIGPSLLSLSLSDNSRPFFFPSFFFQSMAFPGCVFRHNYYFIPLCSWSTCPALSGLGKLIGKVTDWLVGRPRLCTVWFPRIYLVCDIHSLGWVRWTYNTGEDNVNK